MKIGTEHTANTWAFNLSSSTYKIWMCVLKHHKEVVDGEIVIPLEQLLEEANVSETSIAKFVYEIKGEHECLDCKRIRGIRHKNEPAIRIKFNTRS